MTAQSQTQAPGHPVLIEVFSDVVCPWCFIGKRRLEQALDRLASSAALMSPGAPPPVQWRAFQLNPGLAAAGMERGEYVARKFGSAAGGVYTRVAAVGQQVGIAFAFDRIARQPNTVDAHRLIRLAGEERRQDARVERRSFAWERSGRDPRQAWWNAARLAVVLIAHRRGVLPIEAAEVEGCRR